MTACQALRDEAELSYSLLTDALERIPQGLAWAQIPLAEGQYLHSNGTIIGIITHIAVCKIMYASTAFRDTEVRWRECIERLETIGTDWDAAKSYLAEAHQYWLSSWEHLTDYDLIEPRMHIRGVLRPTWRLIATVTQHDAHHLGQIELLASVLVATEVPPDMQLEQERKAVSDLPGW